METKNQPTKTQFILRMRQNVQGKLIAGLLIVVPLWLTYVALKFLFFTLDGFFGPLITRSIGFAIPGLGFILLLIFLYLIGAVTTNILGRSLVHFWESVLERIPLVKNIYHGAKQLIQTISLSKTFGFKRVVFIEYPRLGSWAIGFLTNSVEDKGSGKHLAIIFLPSPPNPINGMFVMIPEQDVIETNLTIEDGIKMVVSAGMVMPPLLTTHSGTKPPR
ncbi:MAG: DUF502 domain-containing protein [Candidatus Omnitrophica bacterium]|nr:DUF502 domain-containing protein [Candidatus Omnitrophota bacterium]